MTIAIVCHQVWGFSWRELQLQFLGKKLEWFFLTHAHQTRPSTHFKQQRHDLINMNGCVCMCNILVLACSEVLQSHTLKEFNLNHIMYVHTDWYKRSSKLSTVSIRCLLSLCQGGFRRTLLVYGVQIRGIGASPSLHETVVSSHSSTNQLDQIRVFSLEFKASSQIVKIASSSRLRGTLGLTAANA